MSHVGTVAAMHGRELGRRRLALAILVALPLVFYLAGLPYLDEPGATADDTLWVLVSGAMGSAWSVAVAALFLVVGWPRADTGLLHAGYRPTELVAGRVTVVLGLGVVITGLFTAVIASQQDVDVAVLALSIAASSVVAVGLGVLAAALVPREMEGVLVVIGLVGTQMTVLEPWMPLWGAGELLVIAAGATTDTTVGTALAHSAIAATALLAVGSWLWARRVRVRPPTVSLPAPGTRAARGTAAVSAAARREGSLS